MKALLSIAFTILLSAAFSTTELMAQDDASIKWMSWEEAVKANEEAPKKIFIDVYTDWCGWCKRMDSSTFRDPKIIKELNDNFYSVKFNAEQKEQIDFNGNAFNFVDAGRRGYHQLAYSLLDGRMAYPAFVMLNENFERVMLSPGYKQVDQLIKELTFTSTEAYKKVSWDQYKGS